MIHCPLCDREAIRLAQAFPGYQRPQSFDLYACSECRCSFAMPMRSEEAVYEAIYRHAAQIPGYDRYDAYARLVTRAERPLDALADREEPYWALRSAVRDLPAGASTLDIGSGLGYVTYALIKHGFRATGLDISEQAVDRARRRFGDYYVAADMFAWSESHREQYDVVSMLELIEHVEDPVRWIEAAFRMVKPGGMLVMTTPNRDYFVEGTVWSTDAPPVHLWWFTAQTLRRLCESSGGELEFVDFSACTLPPGLSYDPQPNASPRAPQLDERGRPASALRRALFTAGLLPVAKAVYARLEGGSRRSAHPNGTRETLGAVLRKPR